ncbi:MAG TPA: 2-oxo acid dehydrogenase subunit E2 [Anaerolineales bacterium]|nr:2-oxo acid dehydrogenase subunit E2 [Anaerolineales bacterium]
MAVEFFIPKLGQTVEEVTIVNWLVEDGAKVEQGQPVLEVETDKTVFPLEATAGGYLHRGPFKEGDIVPVVTTVAIIGEPNDRFMVKGEGAIASVAQVEQPVAVYEAPPTGASQVGLSGAVQVDRLIISPRARKLASEKKVDLSRLTPTGGNGVRIVERDVLAYLDQLPKVSPLAHKVAAEAQVDLESLVGTGPGGRIMKTDVERSLRAGPPVLIPESLPPLGEMEVVERIPLSGIRGIIAERMGVSVHTTARVTLVMEVDATEFVTMRERIKARVAEEWGFAPGYNDLLAKIVASALRKFPYMNARLTDDAIEYLRPINLGMATDTERGLLVPVIRDADQKSLRQFGLEFRQLVERARNRKSLPDDLTGGTFTITSLGAFGVDAFTPVINLPEAAILGVGRIAPKVVPWEGQPVVRTMCTLSLVFDHRLVDGAPAARFFGYIKDLIEEPYLLVSALQESFTTMLSQPAAKS